MKEAVLWDAVAGGNVRCRLCNHRCLISDGKVGFCGVRKNEKGKLYALTYGKAVSSAVDPIEKKPFYHWFPRSLVYSFAAAGCNFRCKGCQNSDISQHPEIPGHDLAPKAIVEQAVASGCKGIAYTYTEPTIFFEYAKDTAELARKRHLYSVFVTNGYMTPEAIAEMAPIDASRIDLKFMDEKLYNSYCGVRDLENILESIRLLHKKGHVEVINLVIPSLNDSDDAFRQTAQFVAGLSKDVPLHFIAFHPQYKAVDLKSTDVKALERARGIALDEGLNYAYVGNVPGHPGENTFCPKCGAIAIERYGFDVVKYLLNEKHECLKCGGTVLVWDGTNYRI